MQMIDYYNNVINNILQIRKRERSKYLNIDWMGKKAKKAKHGFNAHYYVKSFYFSI